MTTKIRSALSQELQKALAERVKQSRLKLNWTRQMLSEQSGVNQHTLKRFELTGEISLSDFTALCESLDGLLALNSVLKPRWRVNVDSWEIEKPTTRQRAKKNKIAH